MSRFGKDEWEVMLRRIKDHRCVAFLGAGASVSFNGDPGLPTAAGLAEDMANECDYPPGLDRRDFFRVAQYYVEKNDRELLGQFLQGRLAARVATVPPTVVHRTIAALPFEYVLTTNFDNLMEEAYRKVSKKPQMCCYRRFGPTEPELEAGSSVPVVYKLHGNLDDWDAFIATEHDVVEFMSCVLLQNPPLPKAIHRLFETHAFLFIGYGLKDWNVRVLIQAIRNGQRGRPSGIKSFAVQRRPLDEGYAQEWDRTVKFWDRQANMACANMDAAEFVQELADRARSAGIIA